MTHRGSCPPTVKQRCSPGGLQPHLDSVQQPGLSAGTQAPSQPGVGTRSECSGPCEPKAQGWRAATEVRAGLTPLTGEGGLLSCEHSWLTLERKTPREARLCSGPEKRERLPAWWRVSAAQFCIQDMWEGQTRTEAFTLELPGHDLIGKATAPPMDCPDSQPLALTLLLCLVKPWLPSSYS